MSENDDLITSLYPPPPPYYRFFTDENLQKLQQWQEASETAGEPAGGAQGESDESKVPEAPEEANKANEPQAPSGPQEQTAATAAAVPPGELRFLVPPAPPAGSHYRNYGNLWSFEDKLPSLKEMGLRQLYKDDDATITSKTKIEELHRLLDSLLLNFLELIGVVSVEPEQFHHKIEDLKVILININHILNSYRPHQSRESLIMLLRRQIEAKRGEIAKIESVSGDVRAKITGLLENLTVENPQPAAPAPAANGSADPPSYNLDGREKEREKEKLRADIVAKLLADAAQ